MPYRKLGRRTNHRRSLLRNQVTSLLLHERMATTEAKAKEIRGRTEHLITLAKRGDLNARRQAAAFLMDEDVLKKLFDQIGPRYNERAGGYTRVLKTGTRRGDAAPMAVIELV